MNDNQKLLLLIVTIGLFYLIYLLTPILTPFLIGGILAYLGDPIVGKLEKIKFTRTVSVGLVFIMFLTIMFVFILVVFPVIEGQIRRLLTRIPEIIDWLQLKLLPWLSQSFSLDLDVINFNDTKRSLIQHWQSLGNVLGKFIVKIFSSGQLLVIWLSYVLLIPIVTFYLLRDWDILISKICGLIPRNNLPLITNLARESNAVVAEFFRGQLTVIFIQSTFYSLGLWFIGLEFSLLIGLIAGVISFIPFLGVLVGVVIASFAAFIQFHEFLPVIYILIIFGIGQVLEGSILTPLLIGERIGLHPVVVIFVVMAGAQLLGLFGMLIALPVAAVISVILRYLHQQYLNSSLYSE